MAAVGDRAGHRGGQEKDDGKDSHKRALGSALINIRARSHGHGFQEGRPVHRVEFPPFLHAQLLAKGWAHGAPEFNLGASAFVNEDPLEGLPTQIDAADVALFDLHAATAWRDAVAHHLGLPDEAVRATAGTTAANTAVIMHAFKPGCNVVCERPYYAPMPHTAQGLGAEVRFVDRDEDGQLDVEKVVAAMDDKTALVMLTSPNNPTGAVTRSAKLVELAKAAADVGALVLVDQVYRELTDHALAAGLHPALVSTGSLNKCWGAPGLRAGWAAGDAEVMAAVEEIHRTLSLGASSSGTRLGVALLGLAEPRRRALEVRLAKNHAIYTAWCSENSLEPALGILTAFPKVPVEDTWAFAEQALGDGLLLIPGECFGRGGHIRIGLGVPTAQLRPALDALSARW